MNARYQDGGYLEHNPDWHAADSPWKARHVLEMLGRHQIAPRSVCEVGSGAGQVLALLAQGCGPGTQCVGFDVSPQAHALSKQLENAQLAFRLGDVFAAVPPQATPAFDLVLALDVFEHVDDYLGFLRRLRPLGKDKIFHIPLDLSAQVVLRGKPLTRLRRIVGHLHYFTKDTALETLADAGYTVVDHRYTSHFELHGHRSWRKWVLALPRKLLFALHQDFAVRLLGGYSLLVLAR